MALPIRDFQKYMKAWENDNVVFSNIVFYLTIKRLAEEKEEMIIEMDREKNEVFWRASSNKASKVLLYD